jgi:N-ethylmaleimide reductase
MNERGLFTAVDSTLPAFEYVYDKLNAYDLSHVFLMRQMADLSKTPIAALAGDAVIHHFRKIYNGQMILNVGITREHAKDLISAGLGDFIAFGREYIANPDLVERIRVHAPLNEQRPEGYYGETAFGYTDYPFLAENARQRANHLRGSEREI